MFLNKVIEENPKLVRCAFDLHGKGMILPDTYILDLDRIIENARAIKEEADKHGIDLYFMLKQIGRNPLVAKELMDLGFKGAVTVDFKEALTMIDNNIHISNVGHLVQVPGAAMEKIIASKPDYFTVYSKQMIGAIDGAAKRSGHVQKLLIRLTDPDSKLYSGQIGGFLSSELEELYGYVSSLDHVQFAGFTVFPAFLYDEAEGKIMPTDNVKALERGLKFAEEKGLKDLNINLPSATCCASIPLIAGLKGSSGEPGHGLTGTTPLHKVSDQPEKPAYVYVSEVSHNYGDHAYCYGGGHYRRSHMEHVLVGKSFETAELRKISAPSDESIDYHFEIEGNCGVFDCCVMAFRTQVFTTRSHVAVVKGISNGRPEIMGLYDALGNKIGANW